MDRRAEAKQLFQLIVDRSPEERARYLDEHCPEADLRREVEDLLRHFDATMGLSRVIGAEPVDPSTVFAPGQRLGHFQVIREIGRGGMGVVYLAQDTQLDRRVALKVLPPHFASEISLARFRNEAKAIARLEHRNVVPVHTVGEQNGVHFLAMGYIEGLTLAQRIEQESKDRSDSKTQRTNLRQWHKFVAGTLAKVADALDHAHQNGIIHRDVKPSNILLDGEGEPYVTDFGLAKTVGAGEHTATGTIAGTARYMSPEQARAASEEIDHRTDIFSLGVTLYETVALRAPFQGESVDHILRDIIAKDPRRLRQVEPAATKDLETICHKALEKKKQQRYQMAGHFAADLRCYLANAPILAKPPTLARRVGHWGRQHRLAVLSMSVVLLAGAVGFMLWQQARLRRSMMAAVTVTSEPAGAAVYVQPIREIVPEVGETRVIGRTPLENFGLEPGLYRVIAVMSEERFAETTVYLPEAGDRREIKLYLKVRDASFSADMAYVDGKVCHIGREDGDRYETKRTLTLPPYYIDKYAVTNAEYAAFVEATGHLQPGHWERFGRDPMLDDRPVVAITWEDAQAYARWVGKRLPTTFEWEAAARYPDGRFYPWGDEVPADWDPAPAEDKLMAKEVDWQIGYELYVNHVRAARRDVRPSKLELHNTFANTLEFTSSLDAARGPILILKGGGWTRDIVTWNLSRTDTFPIGGLSLIAGFRCAVSESFEPKKE